MPASLPDLLSTNVQNSHVGDALDNLKIYILSLNNFAPTGNLPLTSTFTQNGAGNISGNLQTYLRSSALAAPFPDPTSLASLSLTTLLGSAVFPPSLSNFAVVDNANAAPNYSLAAVYDVTAGGTTNSNATINISGLGPSLARVCRG